MLTTPVLVLNTERINEIDPRNVESLFGMWTVFNRCASTIQEGRRLENLSWRVWGRETLCCPPQPERTIVPSIDVSPSRSSIPSLSSSVESDTSIEASKSFSTSVQERCRKLSESEDSALSKSRGKEQHLSPQTLEKIVTAIHEKVALEPLSPAIEAVVSAKIQAASSPPTLEKQSSDLSTGRTLPYSTESSCMSSTTATTATTTTRHSDHRGSETSASSAENDGLIRSGSVVHGFSPAASSFRSSKAKFSHGLPNLAANKSANKNLAPAKAGMFTLGGSSEDDESSFEQRFSLKRTLPEKRTSSLSQSLGKNLTQQKKTTSFRDIVEQRRIQQESEDDEGAIASSDEEDDDDDAIESAIEEEDDADDWEDSVSEDGRAALPDFKRIDSRPNLVSRRSVLTQGLNEGDRAKGLLNAAVKSQPNIRPGRAASHNGPSAATSTLAIATAASPDENDEDSGMVMQTVRGSKPLPIIPTTSNTYAMAHSPRTTRRNMLSTELTESLRKNLLWERQQKNTNQNFLRRQAQSMANLQRLGQAPAAISEPINGNVPKPFMSKDPLKGNNSWTFENPWEYHTKGW